ncbi:ArsR/SmtB family transcription factor [Agrobacterium arsenijevicii]|uniref:HTH arsR-type domain-containing protein n=1 Tax=Agrobacterium arsenijevicii TaxID=1585697 RepID=A0ABR5D089_9HYPH|nr:hypothetical protein RP75_27540 [Agrobacterium arsenijevicii]
MCKDDIPNFADYAALFTALANEKRLHVLTLLQQSELSVGALAEAVGISQSALSQHLSKLRRHGLVSTRRDAQTIFYFSNDGRVARMLQILAALDAGEE